MNLFIQSSLQKQKKYLYQNLQYIYGINLSSALKIIQTLGFDKNVLFTALRFEDLHKIERIIAVKLKKYINVDLKKFNHDNIKLLKRIKSYRGIRHTLSLSVNGQRTKTNAKTQKWKRKRR